MIRTRYLYAILLLGLLHQRNRRRFGLSINSIDCYSTVLYMYTKYTLRTPSVSHLVRTSNTLLCRMADVNVCFPCACSVLFVFTKNCFLNAPLGSTVALTDSSCIPVRPQPLRACAEPQAGVIPPRRRPPCIYIYKCTLLCARIIILV